MPLHQPVKLAFAAFATALLTACGGGGATSESGFTVESGVAQKGPLSQGSAILINELAATSYQPNGKEYTFFTNNNLGTFTPSGITYGTPYLSTYASGYYFNELTGAQSNDTVGLRGLSQIGKVGSVAADTVINVNALSSVAVNRITLLATTAPVQAFAAARAQAQKEALGAFYIYNGTSILTGTTVNSVAQPGNLTALDLSKSRAGDQILAALSAVVMTAGVNGAGVNSLLSQIASDLADDGLLNNSTQYRTSVQSRLCAAAAGTDFAAVAANLNSFYGTTYQATDLSQWVDTSGCVDQVINKYKFSAGNIAVGTVSQSPAYVAGPDDVGQCFSVGGASSGATAGLFYKGGTSAIVGTQKVVLGDSMTIGLNATAAGPFSGFIQRSPPAANGTCPSVVPITGLTRVLKYTTTDGYIIGGTVSGLAAGQSVTFLNNGGNALTVSANGSFSFTNTMTSGAGYAITVGTQPFASTCTVERGSGTTSTNVANVVVSCGPGAITVSTFAGTGAAGSANGDAVTATFNSPIGVAVDSNGNVYVADHNNCKIRKISAIGAVSTLAGTGIAGDLDGPSSTATFRIELGVAVDSLGNLYVSDTDNNKIRKITSGGMVSTFAGTGSTGNTDGPGSTATFSHPVGIAVDIAGNVYVADQNNFSVRKITPNGVVSTLAGGAPGSADGAGSNAKFSYPWGVAGDSVGTVYVGDAGNNKIRKITSDGVVSTLAGTGELGNADGVGSSATFRNPLGVAVDAIGNVYVADGGNKIRKISVAGQVSTIAGTGAGGATDGAGATATFSNPQGIAVDSIGNLYVGELGSNKVRKISQN